MSKAAYVYVTYIAATPEKIFDALINKEATQQYWGHHNISDWKPGSTWEHRVSDKPEILHIVGKVVEIDRPRRLVITWSSPEDQGNPQRRLALPLRSNQLQGPTSTNWSPPPPGSP